MNWDKSDQILLAYLELYKVLKKKKIQQRILKSGFSQIPGHEKVAEMNGKFLECKGVNRVVPYRPVQRLLFNIFIKKMEEGLVLNSWCKIIQIT